MQLGRLLTKYFNKNQIFRLIEMLRHFIECHVIYIASFGRWLHYAEGGCRSCNSTASIFVQHIILKYTFFWKNWSTTINISATNIFTLRPQNHAKILPILSSTCLKEFDSARNAILDIEAKLHSILQVFSSHRFVSFVHPLSLLYPA